MASESHDRLVQRLGALGVLSEAEQGALHALPFRVRDFARGADIVEQGQRPTESCIILHGLVCRYKLVAGGQRQILALAFTGDMPDLQSLFLPVMDHGISCITGARAGFVPHQAVLELGRQHPSIGELFFKHTLIDAAIFRDWIANLGRRSAYERIAHLFCEVFVRMRRIGLVQQDSFRLPMTQSELADACGISPVHVNRVLQQLRRDGLIISTGEVHAIANWEALREAGDFDEAYLHYE